MTPAPYRPRHRRSKAAYGPRSAAARYRRGVAGPPTGGDILFLILAGLALPLAAALTLGGLLAHPFG